MTNGQQAGGSGGGNGTSGSPGALNTVSDFAKKHIELISILLVAAGAIYGFGVSNTRIKARLDSLESRMDALSSRESPSNGLSDDIGTQTLAQTDEHRFVVDRDVSALIERTGIQNESREEFVRYALSREVGRRRAEGAQAGCGLGGLDDVVVGREVLIELTRDIQIRVRNCLERDESVEDFARRAIRREVVRRRTDRAATCATPISNEAMRSL